MMTSETSSTMPTDSKTGRTTKTSNSPKTGDNIMKYVILMLVSVIGIYGSVKFIKKKD